MTSTLQQDLRAGTARPPLADPATAQHGAILFRRFLRLWIPLLVALVAVEVATVAATGSTQPWLFVVLTIAVGAVMLLGALSLSRQPSCVLPILTAALADAAGIATGFLSSSVPSRTPMSMSWLTTAHPQLPA